MHKLIPATALALAVALLTTTAPAQQRYPSRPVEVVVAYGPGGSTDQIARPIAQKLQERLGQSFVVMNKPGGNGTIGAIAAARAAPDGYTLFMGYNSETVLVPILSKTANYSVDDFEPIAVAGIVPLVLIVSKNVRANNLQEFIAEMRASPGKYTYGGGLASPPHLMGAWFHRLNNLNVNFIPYRGGGQVMSDLVGGHLDMFYGAIATAKGAIASGSVKAIAVTGEKRSAALPDVPTFTESGSSSADLAAWAVMFAPKGTPADVVALLRKETLQALGDPKLRELFGAQGVEPSPTQDVRAFIAQERERFGRVVRELGVTLE